MSAAAAAGEATVAEETGQGPASMWALRACELLVALMFATDMPWERSFGWFGVIVLLGVLRWWHVNRPAFRALPRRQRQRTYRLYMWALMAYVGSSCWFLYVPGNLPMQAVLMCYLLGNATFIAVRLTGDTLRSTIAMCLAVMPTAVRMMVEGVQGDDRLLFMMGIGGVMMTVTMVFLSRAQETNARRQSEQRHRAEAAADAIASMGLAKSRFFAAVSHDLRQPVHAIGLYLEPLTRLAQRAGDDASVRAVDGIAQSWRALDGLLSQVLDLTRMDSGMMEADLQPVEVGPLVSKLVMQHSAVAEQSGVRLVSLVRSGRFVLADELMLARVLSNLLDNAVKFSPPGGMVAITLRRGPAGSWRLQVRDGGSGIALEAQQRIFEEFVQVGNEARDRRQGLGLGLAIARRFVVLMNGDIHVRSAPGRGCSMTLLLPQSVPSNDAPRAHRATSVPAAAALASDQTLPPLSALPVRSVLLVEDDLLVASATSDLLQSWGLSVRHVETAAAAIRESAFGDVAICDARLPSGASGLDVALHLRRLGKSVLLISGETNAALREAAQAHRVPLLTKPVSTGQLFTALRAL